MKTCVEFSNGNKMPLLGLGTLSATNREELEKALGDALEAGYRHFDTAFVYFNESIIGDVLHGWITSGKVKREELFITTKLPPNGMEASRVEHFIKLQLKALRLDYFDLYLVHGPIGVKYIDDMSVFPMEGDSLVYDLKTDLVRIWKGMEAQVTAGRAKAIGISNFSVEQIERIVKSAKILPANLQVEAHVWFQQKKLREVCQKHGITFTAYAPLGSPGRSANAIASKGLKGWGDAPDIMGDAVVGEIAKAHGKTSAQVMLRFLVQQDVVVIPKSTNRERIFANAAIFDFCLDAAEMKRLVALDKGVAGKTFNMAAWAGIEKHPEFCVDAD